MIKFTKSFKTPDPIPQRGIEQAIKLMQTGRLYRYNFSDNFTNYSQDDDLNNEDEELNEDATEI